MHAVAAHVSVSRHARQHCRISNSQPSTVQEADTLNLTLNLTL